MENRENKTEMIDAGIGVNRDSGMNLSSLLRQSKQAITEEKPLSALEKAKLDKQQGMVIGDNEYQSDDYVPEIKHESENERRTDEFNNTMDDLDKMIEVAKVIDVKAPKDAIEMAQIMDAVSDIASSGNISEFNKDSQQLIAKNENKKLKEVADEEELIEVDENQITNEDEERQKIIEILIDKTGMGANIELTDEDKHKLVNANLLKLTEVQSVDISSVKYKAPKKSFLETIQEHSIATTMTPVVFPVSKIGASMKGLSFGELGDIGLDKETLSFGKLNKKYSIIYKNLVNSSVGKFADYEDFLKRFAYIDLDMAIYGLVCSTFPEVDSIALRCNAPKCGKMFDHTYQPRALLQVKELSKTILNAMKDVTMASTPKQYIELEESNVLNNRKVITLPFSKYQVELGVASAYEHLHSIMDNILDDKFSKNHPDDINNILEINTTFLSIVRAIAIPINDEYVRFDDAEDVIQALYTIKPEEISILINLLSKYVTSLEIRFALVDVHCPHCGHDTKVIPIDINDLVFMKYQTLGNTTLDLENMLDL